MFDIADPEVLRSRYAHYAQMRANAPVCRDRATDLWFVSTHDLVVEAARNDRVFSSQLGLAGAWAVERDDIRMSFQAGLDDARVLIALDRPEHTILRRSIASFFSTRHIGTLVEQAGDRVESIVTAPDFVGPVEAVSQFAEHLPVWTISKILGISPACASQLNEWSRALSNSWDPSHPNARLETQQSMAATGWEMLRSLTTEVRRTDALDGSVAAILKSQRPLDVSDLEIVSNLALLALTGVHTTVLGLTSVVNHLAGDLELQDSARRDPSMIAPTVSEILRLESPVQISWRGTREPVDLGSARLPAGARVGLVFGSANRDETRFEQPDTFKLGRRSSPVTFGVGIHACVGARLATEQIVRAVVRLLANTTHFELIRPATASVNAITHGYEQVWIDIVK